jgi:AhpD family alkylhydroperoxidase
LPIEPIAIRPLTRHSRYDRRISGFQSLFVKPDFKSGEDLNMFILKEMDELWEQFSHRAYQPGVLDGKTKELIAVSNSVLADCVPCLQYHYKRAKEAGASNEELAECFAIAMSISAGSKKAKYQPLINSIEKE